MKKILVTAFYPFGGDSENSSLLTLGALPETVGDIRVYKLEVPTVYVRCAEIAWQQAKKEGCGAILAMGQAGGRSAISHELVGINYADAGLPDNDGDVRLGKKLVESGIDAYFSTLPVKAMAKAVKNLGFESYVSLSAGGFVCNSMLYTLLRLANEDGGGVRCGFTHLPYEKSQGKDAFSMRADDMALCVSEAIKTIFI